MDELMKNIKFKLTHVKEEPPDLPSEHSFEESIQNAEESDNPFIPTCNVKRRQSTVDEPEPKRQFSEISGHDQQNAPPNASIYQNCQANGSGTNRTSVSIARRDPRMQNLAASTSGPRPVSERRSDHQSQAMKDARTRGIESQKLLDSQSFYANLPNVILAPGGFDQQRSPMLTNNHNALFKSQATTDNIRNSLLAQRFSNVNQPLQSFAQRVGADLDAISQSMQPAVADESSQISYNANTRSYGAQTEPMEHEELAEQPERCSCKNKKLKTTEAQTTKNHAGFYCAIDDLSMLTREQRKGLVVFKQLMNIRDPSGTSDLLERIDHNRANVVRNEFRPENGKRREDEHSQNGYNRGAGSSRAGSSSRFSNPEPPSSQPKPKSKYANAIPK